MRSKQEIQNVTAISYSVQLKIPMTTLEGIPLKSVHADTLQLTTALSKQIFPKGLPKILPGIPVDLT